MFICETLKCWRLMTQAMVHWQKQQVAMLRSDNSKTKERSFWVCSDETSDLHKNSSGVSPITREYPKHNNLCLARRFFFRARLGKGSIRSKSCGAGLMLSIPSISSLTPLAGACIGTFTHRPKGVHPFWEDRPNYTGGSNRNNVLEGLINHQKPQTHFWAFCQRTAHEPQCCIKQCKTTLQGRYLGVPTWTWRYLNPLNFMLCGVSPTP